jgi:hypothetical protein
VLVEFDHLDDVFVPDAAWREAFVSRSVLALHLSILIDDRDT